MNTQFVKSAIEAFKSFVAACSNDVCNDDNNEYTVFAGSIASDGKGNIKTYSTSGELVAQVPLRPILDNAANLGCTLVDLYEASKREADKETEAKEKEDAEKAEKENKDLDNKIEELESQIQTLKSQKKPVRRLVKRSSFESLED